MRIFAMMYAWWYHTRSSGTLSQYMFPKWGVPRRIFITMIRHCLWYQAGSNDHLLSNLSMHWLCRVYYDNFRISNHFLLRIVRMLPDGCNVRICFALIRLLYALFPPIDWLFIFLHLLLRWVLCQRTITFLVLWTRARIRATPTLTFVTLISTYSIQCGVVRLVSIICDLCTDKKGMERWENGMIWSEWLLGGVNC